MTERTVFPARPTTYRGIKMRSRLEADFAHHLDTGWQEVNAWEYEPECFAGLGGQYLPDFLVVFPLDDGKFWHAYVEIKPLAVSHEELLNALERMPIIWESKPQAVLLLLLWCYGEGRFAHCFSCYPGDQEWQYVKGPTATGPRGGP